MLEGVVVWALGVVAFVVAPDEDAVFVAEAPQAPRIKAPKDTKTLDGIR